MSFLAILLAAATPANAPAPPVATVTTRSGIRLETLQPGTGPRPTRKDAVRVTYEVRLADGTLVESTTEPAGLLVSNLIPGLTEALLLMHRGGRYRVSIPARLAYGKTGNADGSVPPNADLVFTVKLLGVGRPAKPPPALSGPRAKRNAITSAPFSIYPDECGAVPFAGEARGR